MHAAMKYLILKTIRENKVIMRENDTTGFTSYVILSADNQHLMTVHYNWKYNDYFIHTANDQTVTEGKMPQSKYAMVSKHHYDLQDIVTACFRKYHNLDKNTQTRRRPVSEKLLTVAKGKMWDEERVRFNLLQKSVRVK